MIPGTFVRWHPSSHNSPGWLASDDGCHVWTGAKSSAGYGVAYIAGGGRRNARLTLVHRYRYEHEIGPIPTGLELDHLCRNRACCNPAHLEPVTRSENIRRGGNRIAAQMAQTHCKNGHALTRDNLDSCHLRLGKRTCIACRRARARRYYAARVATAPQELS